jgi:hypothetical protein
MVDILRFMLKDFKLVSEFLCHLPDEAAFQRSLPQEIFELYLTLLPFSSFTKALERRSCSFPEIVSLSRLARRPRDALLKHSPSNLSGHADSAARATL